MKRSVYPRSLGMVRICSSCSYAMINKANQSSSETTVALENRYVRDDYHGSCFFGRTTRAQDQFPLVNLSFSA